eukprot:TRINITY_DN17149_c0_g4_i1.p1 TRINITY_DN17149_c0_g4~~TRINITY_DN17149_c0_g4_i1.p1  ORF type:complete len:278 (+),score=83.03 TRINITY_DN17149_c0_g4_i1:24-857(+)
MQQVWDNDGELTNELEALKKRVDQLVRNHEGMDPKALKEETKACQGQFRQIGGLLGRQKRDIDFCTKQNGTINGKQRDDLLAQYYQPAMTQHEQLKEKIAGLQGLSSSKPAAVEKAREDLRRGNPAEEKNDEELEEIAQTITVAEVQERAIAIGESGITSAKRSEKILNEMHGMASNIETGLAADREKIEHIMDDLHNLDAQVKRARREVGAFSRRLATDKCFTCLFVLVLLFICAVVGLKIFNKKSDSSHDEDPRKQQFASDADDLHTLVKRVLRM